MRPNLDDNMEPFVEGNMHIRQRVESVDIPNVLKMIIDESVAGTTIIGYAACGTPTSVAKWAIKKVVEVASVTTITWCGGNGKYQYIWDDRGTLEFQ